ncbi:MAG: translation elongation factor Ts [Chloroflexi bacterium]|jgi:elongation factor Ts|nr:translation elongation factor Ts [Chloroflexota bacterium]MBT4004300.1 translation elongation factor Ts [Chloroflexota bacterium]MBT4305703.1 translation elongation factor Ts [Chloroflexota bacterium]MBT4533527.1 translation elongation factor Ts [Chloroflexota bacterium]MBT4681830.1 translation elongation factor Ts [Chloroflexota bacterium]
MAITTEQIKELRKATGAGILDCREALTHSDGDFDGAVDFLREKGLAKSAKRANREASEGIVELYNHGDGRVGVMVEVNCETDFVGRSEGFRKFAHELALQIAATSPIVVNEEDIPEDILDREREVARNMAIEDGKPENILDKIVEGRIEKYKDEIVLMRQKNIRDENITIADMLNENITSSGENLIIRRFARWELGEASMNEDEDEE